MTIAPVTIAVPGIESRESIIASQREQLPGLHVLWDTEREGVWPMTRRALQWGGAQDASHVLILQDDALPCDSLCDNLSRIVEVLPNAVVSLFSMRKSIGAAFDAGQRWVRSTDGLYTQAYLMPRDWAVDALAWCDRMIRPDYGWDDRRLVAYFAWERNEPIWGTCPSLVQHGCPSDSLLGNSHSRRVALTWRQDLPVFDWELPRPLPPVASSAPCLSEVRENLTPEGAEWLASLLSWRKAHRGR
jgi:hypothetical protein